MSISTGGLSVEEKGPITVLTLNRPERMNALDFSTLLYLQAAVAKLAGDDETRVVIITGAGERAFSAGADLKERETMTPEQVRLYIRTIRDTFSAIAALPQPVIAAVNGIALGGGTELCLACDIRIAAENAEFGLTETSLGIIPGAGGTQRLPRIIGRARAKEMILTARRITAAQAEAWGLVNRVVARDQLWPEAMIVAEQIAENAPLAVRQAKYAIDAGAEVDLYTGLGIETRAYDVLIPTEDRREGLAAFREKRKPVYRGR